MVELAYSYDIIEKLLDAKTAPSSHAVPAAPAASVNAGHANAIASEDMVVTKQLIRLFRSVVVLFLVYEYEDSALNLQQVA